VRIAFVFIAACAGHAAAPPPLPPAPPPGPEVHHLDDPDLNPPPARKLLSIDWSHVKVDSDADALALWKQIAPNGDDWEQKLDEVPAETDLPRKLAVALLLDGNFACTPAVPPCTKVLPDLGDPPALATMSDPCLRRLLALWSIAQLETEDLPRVHDALLAIASLPPPESQLVAHAIEAYPESDQDHRLELTAAAWKAGQTELVDGKLNIYDEAHLETAATAHHIDGAIAILPAEHHREVFLKAIADEHMQTSARDQAIVELASLGDKLPADVHTALVAAAKSSDCTVAATAARTLDLHGDHKLVPKLPGTRSPATMMRALCVLASFEQMQRPDEASYLPGYIPTAGMELETETYDAYADPKASRTTQVLKANDVVLPELDDLVRAMRHCTGTVCVSDDREFRFTFTPAGGQLLLGKIEVIERVPCVNK
jgi:hypothetical protein